MKARIRQAFIFGAGGHARVIASLLEAPVTFVVSEVAGGADDQMSVDAFFERADELAGHDIYVGIGDNADRRRFVERLHGAGLRLATCVAPNAFVARDAEIGEGAVLCPGAVVNARARLGLASIVNTLSSVDHDCVLGDYCQVTVGVSIAGTVTVGRNGFFGAKSAVVPNVTIGDDVFVMAGAVVTKDVPSGVVVGGIPATIKRRR